MILVNNDTIQMRRTGKLANQRDINQSEALTDSGKTPREDEAV
jgi:hypothetical protein